MNRWLHYQGRRVLFTVLSNVKAPKRTASSWSRSLGQSAGDKTNYNADIEVEGYNRNGLLNDVLRSINNNTRLTSVNGKVDHNKMATISATIGGATVSIYADLGQSENIPVYVVKRVIR